MKREVSLEMDTQEYNGADLMNNYLALLDAILNELAVNKAITRWKLIKKDFSKAKEA